MLSKVANQTPHLFQVGKRVKHYACDGLGTILQLDTNLIDMGYSSTTCLVQWDDCEELDVQWTNKLFLV